MIAIAYKFPKPYLSSIFVGIAAATTSTMWEGAISVLALTGTSLGTIWSFQKKHLEDALLYYWCRITMDNSQYYY